MVPFLAAGSIIWHVSTGYNMSNNVTAYEKRDHLGLLFVVCSLQIVVCYSTENTH